MSNGPPDGRGADAAAGRHPPSFDLAPDELRRLGRQVIDLMIEAVDAERSGPVMRAASGRGLLARMDEPPPEEGSPPDAILAQWRRDVAPFCRRNGHPRFFGYVCTSADPLGMLADAMASAWNQPVTAWRSAPGATTVERLVVRWLDELMGFGGGGNGLLVSGGSAANFHGLACAVTRAERRAGLPSGSRHRLTAYLTGEAHVSLRKALRLLGVPPRHTRVVETDDRRRMRVDRLGELVRSDRREGLTPAVVCASAGTVNTGAIDDLLGAARACGEEGVWLHVDGSYGAPAVMTEEYRWMAEGFARADSLSLDPHKWLFAPADAGCVLVRDAEAQRDTFTMDAEYTEVAQTDLVERYAFFDHGLEMSRRFRGLKVWTILKARGAGAIRRAIAHDIGLRRYLEERVAAEPRLEPLGGDLSIACFRYRPPHATSPDAVDAVNRRVVERLVAEGRCYLSPTTLDGRFALRACIVNFRTRREDVDLLVDEVLRLGERAAR